MDLLLDLKLEEDAESVEAAVAEAAASFSPEAQYRGALRWLRRLSREAEGRQVAETELEQQPDEAETSAPGHRPQMIAPLPALRRVWPRPPGRPRPLVRAWKDTSKKMWERTYALIEANPQMPYEQMAEELYGDTSQKAKSNVRSQCAQLKKEGLIRSIQDGLWEVIPEAEREQDQSAEETADGGAGEDEP